MIAKNSLLAEEDNLPPRSRLWRIGLAEDLRDPAFVKAFLRALTAEGVAVEGRPRKCFTQMEARRTWCAQRP